MHSGAADHELRSGLAAARLLLSGWGAGGLRRGAQPKRSFLPQRLNPFLMFDSKVLGGLEFDDDEEDMGDME